MSWLNKVIWSEGLFLRPQLFQQQERYLENYAHQRTAPLSPFFWGFSSYQIETGALALGKLTLASGTGVFLDGTPFELPGQTAAPAPLTILPSHVGQVIYLTLPIRAPNTEESTFDARSESSARHTVIEEEIRDSTALGQEPHLVQLAQLRLRLLPHNELGSSLVSMPVAKIRALHSDGRAELDPGLIPPVSSYGASSVLCSWLDQLVGLTSIRGEALAMRLTGTEGNTAETSEVTDYLVLQMVNRYQPLLSHLMSVKQSSPESLYLILIAFAGELSTYIRTSSRRPKALPPYLHQDPYASFRFLVDDISKMLNEVVMRGAQCIELVERQHGVHHAVMDAAIMAEFGYMVLAVSAHMPSDVLVPQFIAHCKVGPSDQLPELIRSHLPGIKLSALPVTPRQIPFNAGFVYYELERHSAMWEHIQQYGGLSLHVAKDFPGIRIELWGIREK